MGRKNLRPVQRYIIYDFLIHQEAGTEFNTTIQKNFGLGATVVLYLTKHLKKMHIFYTSTFFLLDITCLKV